MKSDSEILKYGDVILKERHLREMNQTDFGEFLGVGQGTISMWELGTTSPTLRTAKVVLKRLGYDLLIKERA